jgi:hypothetical protein
LAIGLACMAMGQQPTTTASTPPVDRPEVDSFSKFLLNHPGAMKTLQQNPALLSDPKFVAQHPELQTFLKNNPGVAQQIQANPTAFVNDTRQFMARGGEVTRAQAASADQFLESHPEIRQELRQNPSLIDNKQYLEQHPELQQYLNNNPGIRKEWTQFPGAFESRAAQYAKNPNPTPAQIADADRFMNKNPQMAQELRQNPSLIDNKQYLEQHPELNQFLKNNPEIRQEWQQHPEKFTQRAEQYQKNHPPKPQQAKSQQAKAQKPKT